MATKTASVDFVVPRELVESIREAFPNMSVQEVCLRAVKKAVAEAKLQAFARAKQAELQAEEARLNEELRNG